MSSLQNLCLKLIAREFERFHLASSDENLKRNIEFLQRTYSSELAEELFARDKLKDEFLEFIINNHLKFLHEKWLEDTHYEKSMKDIFCRLPNLTKIILFRKNTDEILENLAKFCPKIAEIDTLFISDAGVKHLCANDNGNSPCPELKKIAIRSINYRLTDEGMELMLRNIKSLESVRHRHVAFILYYIYREYLPNFEKMPPCNLVELNITDDETLPYFNDLFRIALTVCPKLKSLSCFISDKEQLNYFNNICLEELILSFRKSSEKINIDSFLKNYGHSLVTLRIYNCLMSISGLAFSCPNLRCLVLDDVTIVENHYDSKAVFQSLVNCTFCQTKDKSVTDKALSSFLLCSPNLQEVKFIHRDLSPDVKTALLKCCEKNLLKTISFMVCKYLDKDFVKDILVTCRSLKNLEVWDCIFEEVEDLIQFAETLPNKPNLVMFKK